MAVTANQITNRRDGCRTSYPVAVANLYEGTMAFVNAAGYADSGTSSGASQFGGMVINQQDNSSGTAGDLDVECWIEGEFLFTGTGFAQADIGQTLYATDNFTTGTAPGTAGVPVGEITRYVSSTQVWATISVLTGGGGGEGAGAQTVTPNSGAEAASLIQPGVSNVQVAATTNDANDFIVLPSLAEVAVGHQIRVANNGGGNCEVRTPATSGEKINTVDSDGTQEYLLVDAEVTVFTKVSDTDGWAAYDIPALGGVGTATVPD